ncbi:DNA polymerase beta superfamily protein [Flavobacterium orientale]|uniref:Nucleotidyltransferase n=1 Tax=Flavobacterium orientale TaxID=1756020 RepID=A0A917DEA1_9FLAO|nr:nucleotidyltransferase domain-containing protein [Flavobacterium orientale]GGD30877.1 hypothetical protein GCM10011343_21280 [Flavobacterium orientale]
MTIKDLKSQNLLLFEVISGSKSFGLDTPTSDTDIKGVFYLPKEQFYGLYYVPQISNETNDEVYYELGRFIELLLKNNPNILELLATPEDCVLFRHPLMEHLKLEDFLSKLCKDSFAGYAMTQIKKARGLKKKIVNPMEKERKGLLDFCYVLPALGGTGRDLSVHDLSVRDLSVRDIAKENQSEINSDAGSIPFSKWVIQQHYNIAQIGLSKLSHIKDMYAVFYDKAAVLGYRGVIKNDLSNDVSVSSIPKGERIIAYLFCNKEAYSTYCKEYTEYWDWIEKRNNDRYETNLQHGKNYDSKNMMHTIRLLQSAKQILGDGTLDIRVKNREELLAIKAGEMEYDDLLTLAGSLIEEIETAYQRSSIPDQPNQEKVISMLVKIREELYS